MNDEKVVETVNSPLKLNWKRTLIIGFAFFGILLLWQVYDYYCQNFLQELFMDAFNETDETKVQYLVGIIMALDNLAALLLLPLFGKLSDKTKSPLGKRMPYIVVGSVVCAIVFPFIPIFFHYNNLAGVICMMLIIVVFMMMYRNPAVSLMPDMTPKPLRSKANGLINIMGYLGGAVATVLTIFLALTSYLTLTEGSESFFNNIWVIEIPFIIASVLLIGSTLVLLFTIKENKIQEEVAEDMKRGEAETDLVEQVDDDQPLSRKNKIMLILILASIFFWFMADNAVSTFMTNYTISYLTASSSSYSIAIIVGGVGSVIGFAVGGLIAQKIGRKRTIVIGLALTIAAYALWMILSFSITPDGSFPIYLFIVWFIKGFGMSLVHVNSYPMVVELCTSKKIGAFTGYYYAASMLAQTITPVLLGLLLLIDGFTFWILPVYALICTAVAIVIFIFVKNVKSVKTKFKTGLESMDVDD